MGIKGLMKLLSEQAPGCFKQTEVASFELNINIYIGRVTHLPQVKNYMGRVVAIDASMQLYQVSWLTLRMFTDKADACSSW